MSAKIIKLNIDHFDGDYAFLSNFYESEIIYEGIKYPTVEHAFQAAKSMEQEIRFAIAAAKTPNIAKRMGRQVSLRKDWEQVKTNVMLECVKEKFKNPVLRTRLLATAPHELIEGNTWHDNCWGSCTCEKCKNKVGENRLGKILMQVREEIIAEYAQKEVVKLLVVVDMQNDFVYGALGGKSVKAAVPNIVNKIEHYIHNNGLVAFTQDTHTDRYLETSEGKNLPVPHCIMGTEGWNLIPELQKYAIPTQHGIECNSIIKTTFGSTHLAASIKELYQKCVDAGKTLEVEFVGTCTDICVVSNCLLTKAFAPEVKITVDAACCAGTSYVRHKAALDTMKSCQIEVVGE